MSIEASEEHVSHFVSCQNLKSQFSHSNIRNNSPIFLHILSCTRSSMFRLPYDKSESNKGGMFMYPYYQPIPVRSAPIGPVGDSRFFRFGVPFLAGIAGGLLGGALAFGPRPFYPPYPPPFRRQHLILVTVDHVSNPTITRLK